MADQRDGGRPLPQLQTLQVHGAPSLRSPSHFRSQSLPRMSVAALDAEASGQAAAGGWPPGGGGAGPPPPAASPDRGERFQRAALTVRDCKAAARALSERANSARSFREKCSNLQGAGIAASLALQEMLTSLRPGGELAAQHLAAEVQRRLLSGEALARKYGHQRLVDSLVRWGWEPKEEVDAKFDRLIAELQELANKIWDQIDPENRLKRNVVSQGHASSVTSGNAFSRLNLRLASKHKVSALLAFPDAEADGFDGLGRDCVVAWAAHRNIKLVQLGSQVETVLKGAGELLQCMVHDRAGFLWSGHADGTVRIWSLDGATDAAAPPLHAAAAPVTALAVDPDTGYCWAGTAEGEIAVVRFRPANGGGAAAAGACAGAGAGSGALQLVRVLLGYDAHSPSAPRSIDSGSSNASSSAPMAAAAGFSTHWVPPRDGRPQPPLLPSLPPPQQRALARRQQQRLRKQQQRQQRGSAGLRSLDLLESCLGAPAQAPGRVKDSAVHQGPVTAIVHGGAGRTYTAGGSGASTASVLVWDSERFELLRSLNRRTSRWCRYVTTSMAMVHWPSTAGAARRSSCALSSAASLATPTAAAVAAGSGSGASGSAGLGPAASGSSLVLRPGSERSLVTGHPNGSMVLWDASADSLRPVLLVSPERGAARQPVRCVAVVEELGLLACGHANGKVFFRKLDPKTRKQPRDGASSLSRWNPPAFCLCLHRLGLSHMASGGHLLVSSGKTGSVKMWPEATLRCLASAAGIDLPHNNPMSEAVNALLAAGGPPYAAGPRSSASASQHGAALPSAESLLAQERAASSRQQQQQQLGGGLANGAAAAATQQQLALALARQSAADAAAAAAAAAADERPPPQPQPPAPPPPPGEAAPALQRNNSSARWSRDIRASNWTLEFDSLGLDARRRRVIGSGSYGRVEIGCINQTDVAVKFLTDPSCGGGGASGASGARPLWAAGGTAGGGGGGGGGGGEASAASAAGWDEARLRALRQEVGILATLRHPNVVLFMGVCLAPPAVVTEYCPQGSLYDVLKRARSDGAVASRLTWTRRLLMALDAARGMLYLHSHRPTILHRDLKSPNLFVTNALLVKVGDFNLSRYMSLGDAYVKSSLEINPRWNAPEVICEGFYSPAADVFSFGVVLWELLTWQEPWEEEGLSSFQIMVAVQQQQQRPHTPPLGELPGQLGPQEAVAGYLELMHECWAQDHALRPSFGAVVTRIKALLRMGGPNAAAGAGAGAAAPPRPRPPPRNASEGAALGAAAAPVAAAGHRHSRSEAPPGAAAAAAAAGGPEVADLLQLADNDDDLPGPSRPAPPAAALPPIAGCGLEVAPAAVLGSGTGLSPRPSLGAAPAAAPLAAPAAVAGWGQPRASPFSPFAAGAARAALPPQPPQQQQQQQEPPVPVSYGAFAAAVGAAGRPPPAAAASPFASAAVQAGGGAAASATSGGSQQPPAAPRPPPAAAAGSGAAGGASFSGDSFSAGSPPAAGGRSPLRVSPFAAMFGAAAAQQQQRQQQQGSGGGGGADSFSSTAGSGPSSAGGGANGACPLEAAVVAGSAVDSSTRARRRSSSSGAAGGPAGRAPPGSGAA